jgi:hypothetical protein
MAERTGVPDPAVPWRTFLGISLFIAVLAVVYWFASYEYAGTVMLGLASGLSLLSAGYLWWQERSGHAASPATGEGVPQAQYLPHASPWPFGIGVGAFLLFNGLVLGFAYIVPGLLVVAISIAGLIAQTRRRD